MLNKENQDRFIGVALSIGAMILGTAYLSLFLEPGKNAPNGHFIEFCLSVVFLIIAFVVVIKATSAVVRWATLPFIFPPLVGVFDAFDVKEDLLWHLIIPLLVAYAFFILWVGRQKKLGAL